MHYIAVPYSIVFPFHPSADNNKLASFFFRNILNHQGCGGFSLKVVISHIANVEDRLCGEKIQILYPMHNFRGKGAGGKALFKMPFYHARRLKFRQKNLIPRLCGLFNPRYPSFNAFKVREQQFRVYHLNIAGRVHPPAYVNHLLVVKTPHYVGYAIDTSYVAEELVPEPLALDRKSTR